MKAIKKMASRFKAWCDGATAGDWVLTKKWWMEMDDLRVFALVFDSKYLMIVNHKEWPIRLYHGPDITHYRSVEDFKNKYDGPPLTKGFVFGGAHFNPLIL